MQIFLCHVIKNNGVAKENDSVSTSHKISPNLPIDIYV